MADGDFQPNTSERSRGGRGPRDGGGREPGGFRIRLSDNEMRAARAVQEAFGLRSTVAALGLSIRTVAQLLEEGKLDEVVAQHRANDGGRPGGERRGPRPERGERVASNRPNPFARPAKPVNTPPEVVSEVENAAESAPEASEAEATPATSEADQAEA
ncbi:hypothetical protein [Synechococcus sp. CBW1107]|uniref:hypothetical protein n=1 Tax=Synechococcus sp. CBW1107 TaxID=2789857 RepID=UPI002AD1DA57|nr:hypothetical protein [Synechococcus sp. CBW1107]CAK6691017.1 hypothetical protein MNNICLKF_00937 [Synechococcus sp. CBW1107]